MFVVLLVRFLIVSVLVFVALFGVCLGLVLLALVECVFNLWLNLCLWLFRVVTFYFSLIVHLITVCLGLVILFVVWLKVWCSVVIWLDWFDYMDCLLLPSEVLLYWLDLLADCFSVAAVLWVAMVPGLYICDLNCGSWYGFVLYCLVLLISLCLKLLGFGCVNLIVSCYVVYLRHVEVADVYYVFFEWVGFASGFMIEHGRFWVGLWLYLCLLISVFGFNLKAVVFGC